MCANPRLSDTGASVPLGVTVVIVVRCPPAPVVVTVVVTEGRELEGDRPMVDREDALIVKLDDGLDTDDESSAAEEVVTEVVASVLAGVLEFSVVELKDVEVVVSVLDADVTELSTEEPVVVEATNDVVVEVGGVVDPVPVVPVLENVIELDVSDTEVELVPIEVVVCELDDSVEPTVEVDSVVVETATLFVRGSMSSTRMHTSERELRE